MLLYNKNERFPLSAKAHWCTLEVAKYIKEVGFCTITAVYAIPALRGQIGDNNHREDTVRMALFALRSQGLIRFSYKNGYRGIVWKGKARAKSKDSD